MESLVEELEIIGDKKTCPAIGLKNGNKFLIGLRHYTPDKWKKVSVWTFPGGRCDEGETLRQTLEREVAEEVGITDFQIYKFLGKVPGAKSGDTVYTFLGETSQEPKLMEPEKFSEWIWVDINSVPENFINLNVLELIKRDHKL